MPKVVTQQETEEPDLLVEENRTVQKEPWLEVENDLSTVNIDTGNSILEKEFVIESEVEMFGGNILYNKAPLGKSKRLNEWPLLLGFNGNSKFVVLSSSVRDRIKEGRDRFPFTKFYIQKRTISFVFSRSKCLPT